MEDKYITIIPVLSDTIQFNQQTENEFILCNTQHKHYLKINRDVYNILKLIDGKKNLKEISKQYESLYHKNISGDSILILLTDKLASYGVLQGYDEKIKPFKKPSYLKLSFIIINQHILSKIVNYFSPLFRKNVFIILITIMTILTATIFINNIELYRNFNLRTSFLLFFIIQFFSVTFHEIGHASAANYFGAEHGGIGGGFYLFRPVYYADVTDIWKLKKQQRIVVNLAGIYFELIFCFALLLISYFFHNYVLITTSLFVMLSTFFNLNPFIRSDGYWVLSDLTNKLNLSSNSRRKAFQILKNVILLKRISWKFSDVCMAIYGLLQMSFIGLFLYYTLIKNPASIIYFPVNLYDFAINIVNGESFSLYDLRKLLIPIAFYYLAYNFLSSLNKKYRHNGQK